MADDAAAPDGEPADIETYAGAEADVDADEATGAPWSHVRVALIAGLATVVALAGLTGWLGYRAVESHRAQENRDLFLQVARQGALNLTTIDWEHADADVQRVLDSATGTFYDDYEQRAQSFLEVVKKARSTSEGTIADAGLESSSDTEAQALVAVTVKTSNAGAQQQQPRSFRMRIAVEKIGDEAKVSDVEFVP